MPPFERPPGGDDHVEEIQIGVFAGFETEAKRNDAILRTLTAMQVDQPFIAGKDACPGADGIRQRPSKLQSMPQTIRGESLFLIPAPLHAIAPVEAEVWREIKMRIQLQLGPALQMAITGFHIFDLKQRQADAAIEPWQQLAFESRTGELDDGAIIGVVSVDEEKPRAVFLLPPDFQP